jgi:BirA family biotin operon repressor/biotin-[acetyl-CoA-carboxylase] ligase
MQAEPTRVRHVVVGIGINVNHDRFPPEIAEVATSLRVATGQTISRVALTAALLRALDREYRNLADRASILRRFERASSYARGKQVHVEEDGGYDGTTDGLDDRGFLTVKTAAGVRTVLSGGVRSIG